MKRLFTFSLVTTLILSLASCGGGKTKKAFDASKEAYQNVDAAYQIIADFGSDIYEAWRLGIHDDDEIIDEGCSYLAKELALSKNEITDGTAYTLADLMGDNWETCSDQQKNEYRDMADLSFSIMEDDLFSWCVMVVSNAYKVNGKVAEVQEYLDIAKGQMKDLSEKYSDYEHYPALKGYYTTTSSFFDFCQNPTGSFEQLKTTIEDYKTDARDYKADLDYIFEE